MDEAQSIADLSRAVASLTQSLRLALAENLALKQQLGALTWDVRRHDRRAESAGETAQNCGGPGS